MQFKAVLLPFALIGAAIGAVVPGTAAVCGIDSVYAHKGLSQHDALATFARRDFANQSLAPAQPANIGVFVHVVAVSSEPKGGNVPDGAIHAQIAALNQQFAPSGFSFTLQGINRIINEQWSRDQESEQMRAQLRKGSYRDLNLYILTFLQHEDVLGTAWLPMAGARPGNLIFNDDAVFVHFNALPGGIEDNYNSGDVAVHEIGHWLGLLHTFAGECGDIGDTIDDTPAQLSASAGCPKGRDSCPDKPGLDPIDNFMDYTDDTCRQKRFTPGQMERMHDWWNLRVRFSPSHPHP